MHYLVLSFSHKNCDISTREKLAFEGGEAPFNFLTRLNRHTFVRESILVSTCNRVELIMDVQTIQPAIDAALKMLHEHSGIPLDDLHERLDSYEDDQAIHHLFCVASSLDSLVVGETQIAGQMKNAFKMAYEGGFCSQQLSRAMHFAFKCAAEVRNQTEISKNPVSVASASVVMAQETVGNLWGSEVVVIGAGEMSEITVKHLVSAGCGVILVNRDIKKAEEIASGYDGEVTVQPFAHLKELLNKHEILFTATGAPHTVITSDMVEDRGFERFWFDLAVPRDIEEIDAPDIKIYAVDDLKDIVERNISLREEQAREAHGIIGRSVMEFFKWLQTLSVDPIIKSMRDQARNSCYKELEKAVVKNYLPEEYRDQVEKILHAAFNDFLHTPTAKLKELSGQPESDMVVEAVKMLFEIDEEVKMINKYKCEQHLAKQEEA